MIVHACVHLRFFLILHMFNILITYYAQVFPHDLSYAVCINFNPFCFVLYNTCVPCMVSVDEIIIFISHIGSEERSSMRTIPRISWVGRLIINHTCALQSTQYKNNLQLLRYVSPSYISVCQTTGKMATSSDEATTSSESTAVLKSGYLHKQGECTCQIVHGTSTQKKILRNTRHRSLHARFNNPSFKLQNRVTSYQ